VTRVVVLGGGIAGFSAAHELAERGFDVVIAEKTGIPGGKARSSPVLPVGPLPWRAAPRYERSAPDEPVPWIPGEHGFRFFPGFYRHIVDTMTRVPTFEGISAADHLVPISRCGLTQYDKPTFNFPMRFPRDVGDVGTVIAALLAGFSSIVDLPADELAHFGGRIWQILTSCEERRLAEYEQIAWWKFIDAESHSPSYQKLLAAGITRSLVAAHAETASTRTVGTIFIQLLLDILDPLVGTSDRVLDGPTNQVWIYPWLQYLRSLGVTYLAETPVTEIMYDRGRISGVRVQNARHTETLHGDYYVCALPVERTAPLLTPALLRADPRLNGVNQLAARCLEWMNGIQYYFRTPIRLVRGHMNHVDTEWALTSISQVDVWRPGTMDRYGPQTIRSIVSVDVSDWDAAGPNGRSATEHSREDVCLEVWRQLKRSVNVPGEDEILRDEDLIGWFIDSDIDRDPANPGRLTNTEPLLVNLTDSWRLRPDAMTAIPNFFLASDYVRTHTDLATMEAANEAARRAVNGVLDAEGYSGPRCEIWPLHEPLALEPLREYDAMRFGLGLPWDDGLMTVAASAMKGANPLLGLIADVVDTVAPVLPDVEQTADALQQGLPTAPAEAAAQRTAQYLGELRDGVESSVPVTALEDRTTRLARTIAAPSLSASAPDPPEREAGSDDGPAEFSERLEWYRSLTTAAMRDAIPSTGPQKHLYEPVRRFVSRPSKGLRPALCLASCLAFGGRPEDATYSAAGIELLHNAFLVHDDIEDSSATRRGEPTLHCTIGTPLAVNVGDAMNALSMGLFRRNVDRLRPEAALRIFDEVDHMLRESLEGQALELGWIADDTRHLEPDDYLRLVLKKTAWYSFIHPMRIGAIIADAGLDALDRFHSFGFLLGAAFQINDDLLNLTGDEAVYGKEINGDLWEGKRTLPLIYALSSTRASERALLENFVGRRNEGRLPRRLVEVKRILEESGSFDRTKRAALALAKAAEERLPTAFAGAHPGPDLAFIGSLTRFVVERAV
jgi:geranylgeranyl pyrophosphate synthase/uncharacterized protein with NAD-binding domain and iron-sulfur cluster